MPKKLNPNLVKIHRSYEVNEVVDLLGVHQATVRHWLKNGLSVSDQKRPALILGSVLREFLTDKRRSKKQKCAAHEIYCLSCRAPKKPAGHMVDFVPETGTSGRLVGLCPTCEKLIHRYVGLAALPQIQQKLEVSFPRKEKRLSDSN